MTIYQEEMMRNLPKLGCAGKYDETDASLSISYNGVHLCKQLMDGTLFYSDDKIKAQNFGEVYTAISDESYRIREYVSLYEKSPQMKIADVSEYRKFAEFGDTVLAGMYSKNHGFMFCTWKQARNGTYVAHGDYSPNYEYAKQSFISRAGLIDKNRLMSDHEASLLHRCVNFVRDNCEELTYEQDQELDGLAEKLSWGYPNIEQEPQSFSEDCSPQLKM